MAIDERALAAELARHGVTSNQRLERIGIGRRAVDTLVLLGTARRQRVLVSTSWPKLSHRMAVARGDRRRGRFRGWQHWRLRNPIVPTCAGNATPRWRSSTAPDFCPSSIVAARTERRQHPRARRSTPPPSSIVIVSIAVESGIVAKYFIASTLVAIGRECGRPGRPGSGRFAGHRRDRLAASGRSDYELRLAGRCERLPSWSRARASYDGEVIHPDRIRNTASSSRSITCVRPAGDLGE